MGFFSSLLKTPLDICNEELLDLEKTTHIYITNHYDDKRIKAFVKAYNSLTESQINSRLKLMSAYMRDLSRSKRYMIAFSYHNSKEDVIKDYQDFAAYMTAKTVYDKDDLICADTACKLHYLYKKAVSVELAVFLSLKITDLFPKKLLDELLDNYAAHKEYALIQELTLDLLSKYKDTDGKYSYWLASALMVLHPELLKDAKDFAIRAGKKGYPGSDDLLKVISAKLGKKEEIDNAKVEKNLEEMRERMKRAESNRNLYIALCCDGTHVYSDEREKEIAIEAARRYNMSVDIFEKTTEKVSEDQLGIFYVQRRINVAMAKDGVKEFMSRAADALRDGYEYVDQDLETAREYYRIAAEDGDQHAQLYYGVFCKEGYGGPVDYFEAEDAFMQAARGMNDREAGRACFNLAVMNALGTGIPKDEATGAMYLKQARQKGWDEKTDKEFRTQCIDVDNKLLIQKELKKEVIYIDEKTGSYFLPERC